MFYNLYIRESLKLIFRVHFSTFAGLSPHARLICDTSKTLSNCILFLKIISSSRYFDIVELHVDYELDYKQNSRQILATRLVYVGISIDRVVLINYSSTEFTLHTVFIHMFQYDYVRRCTEDTT